MITRRRSGLVATVTVLLGLTACSAPPTQDADQAGAGSEDAEAPAEPQEDPFAPVLAELEGLEGEERRTRLVELAQEEGAVDVYTSNTDLADFGEVFTDEYDVDVNVFRAQSNQVLQRIVQENEANYFGNDLIDTNATELVALAQEDLLRDYEGPVLEGLVDSADQDGWTGTRLNTYFVAYNTDLLAKDMVPSSYEDLADPAYREKFVVEDRAFEWYMTLHDHFVEQGMSEDEFEQMFTDIVSNATIVRGHATTAELLAAGEFPMAINIYNHLVDDARDSGAPVSRDTGVGPVVVRPNGVGLMKTASNPAAALLFFEWLLTDAQELLLEESRVPARIDTQAGLLDGVETVPVDVQKLADEGAEWEERYQELLRNAIGQSSG